MFDVAAYIEDNLDRAKNVASQKADHMTATCPSCGVYGGFYVNIETGAFVCFKCDFAGKKVAGLVAMVEGITYQQAQAFIFRNTVTLVKREDYETLEQIYFNFLNEDLDEDEEPPPPVHAPLPKTFIPCWDGKKWRIPKWLTQNRKVTRETARAWGLGFCRMDDKYGGRLVIPIDCPGGKSFTARDMSGHGKPKYLNPPGADHARLLIGWHVLPQLGRVVLCEGPFDVIKLWQMNVPALAVGGKELHPSQLAMLRTFEKDTKIWIMLDGEEKVAPEKIARKLSLHFKRVRIARLPYKKDPGEASRKIVKRALRNAEFWKETNSGMYDAKFNEFMETA